MIEKITITKLQRISVENGDILHGLKKSDFGYVNFGEIYFSLIAKDKIKAWKVHNEMTLNLIVPHGSVRFNFIELDDDGLVANRLELTLSEEKYCRLTIPPKIIFGFKGVGDNPNIVVNIADIEHKDNEVKKIADNTYKFK